MTSTHLPASWRRFRAAIFIALVLASLQVAVGVFSYVQSRTALLEGRREAAHNLTQGLVVAVAEEWAQRNYGSMEARVIQTMADVGVASVVLLDLDGRELVRVERNSPRDAPTLSYHRAAPLTPPSPERSSDWQQVGAERLTTWAPVRLGLLLGWIRVQSFLDVQNDDLDRLRQQNFWLALLSVLSGAAVLGLFVWRSYRVVVRREHWFTQRLDEASRQLVQSEKLAALGQLAAGVAHEINNPIAYVGNNVRALKTYLHHYDALVQALMHQGRLGALTAADLDALEKTHKLSFMRADGEHIFQETEEGLTRIATIVRDLQNFARADVRQEFVRTDLRHCIEPALNIARSTSKRRVQFDWVWEPVPEVHCVPSQINQVLLNLLVNAVQAIPPEQEGQIWVRNGQEKDQVWITVRDNGSGMSQATLARIFDPFFTTKPQDEGTGLGLSVSLGIVQRHGGRLSVESAPGEGTTFKLSLPIESAAATGETSHDAL